MDRKLNARRGAAAAERAEELGLSAEREWIDWFSVQRNVVIELPGGPEIVYVIAHYDKVDVNPLVFVSTLLNGVLDPLIGWTYTSDGAVDNATGVAVVLQAAYELSKLEDRRYTYRFLLAGSEESGLRGTRAHVAKLSAEEKERIVLALNVDTVGLATTDNCVMSDVSSDSMTRLALQLAAEGGVPMGAGTIPPGASSDHAVFAKNSAGRDIGRSAMFNLTGALLPQRSYFTTRSETEVLFFSSCLEFDGLDLLGGCLLLPTGKLHGFRDQAEQVDPMRLWHTYAVVNSVLMYGEVHGLPL